jgi:hypothetical protein
MISSLNGSSWLVRHMNASSLEASRQMIDLAREIATDKEHKALTKLKSKVKQFFESIKWSDIDLDEDQYIMQVFSDLRSVIYSGWSIPADSRIPPSWVSFQKSAARSSWICRTLKSDNDLDVAALDDIEATIERMIDGGEYESPEPFQNLQLGAWQMCQMAYLKHKNDGAPEEVLRDCFVIGLKMLKP